jgi:hypothetical protein
MALQSSGELTFTQVAGELSFSTDDMSLRGMSAEAGKTVPDSLNEFYGYSSVVLATLGTITRTSTAYTSMNFTQAITNNGGGPISAYGYQYGTSGYTSTITISNSNPGSSFSWSIGSLAANTNYYVRGWVTNEAGTTYNSGGTFSTNAYPAAGTLQTSYCSGCILYYRYHNGSGGTYDVSQGQNDQACTCGSYAYKIVSLVCGGDPYICCNTPCGYLENDDYSGLNSAITCAGSGYYNCTLGAYAGDTSADCVLYWGQGTSFGDSTYGTTNTYSAGSGRCTGNSYDNYM